MSVPAVNRAFNFPHFVPTVHNLMAFIVFLVMYVLFLKISKIPRRSTTLFARYAFSLQRQDGLNEIFNSICIAGRDKVRRLL